MKVMENLLCQLNIGFFALDGENIAFRVNSDPDCPGNTFQIFALSAKKKAKRLRVIEDDLLGKFFPLFSQE